MGHQGFIRSSDIENMDNHLNLNCLICWGDMDLVSISTIEWTIGFNGSPTAYFFFSSFKGWRQRDLLSLLLFISLWRLLVEWYPEK